MKRLWKIAALLLAAVFTMMATGCIGVSLIYYGEGARYTAGPATLHAAVKDLDIDWTAGSVTITTNTTEEIIIAEESDFSLPERLQVHYLVDGSTLRVRFGRSGAVMPAIYMNKRLTVSLPEGLVLDTLKLYCASGRAVIEDGISAKKVTAKSSSGSMEVCCRVEDVSLHNSSGSMLVYLKEEADSVDIHSSSGRLEGYIAAADDVSISTSSGRTDMTLGSVGELDFHKSSGETILRFDVMPKKTTFKTSSGSSELYLPEDASFTAKVHRSSGSFTSEFPLTADGETYVCGSGENRLSIHTSSGSVKLLYR